jgi:glutathione peroxidase
MQANDVRFETISGESLALADFGGRAMLVVNTASECVHTPQYAAMQALWQRYRDRGLVVLGVPSNDFGAQEPGNEAAIMTFCTATYGVDFPMSRKQRVTGAAAHPFYQWVVGEFGEVAAPRWNFHKYLVDRDGDLVNLWPPDVSPLSPEIVSSIEGLLDL